MTILVTISGGKDSTATLILAQDTGRPVVPVFADTGHEHPITIAYLADLAAHLGIEIRTLKSDFTADLARKRRRIMLDPDAGGIPGERLLTGLMEMMPTGDAFADMCVAHGRFPWAKARFCTDELKSEPLDLFTLGLLRAGPVESWSGVRADESAKRANLAERERGMADNHEIVRPILRWTAQETIDFVKSRGAPLNPLYSMGMTRVGCMPCIMARKSELAEMGRRFPAEVDRVERMEARVAATTGRGWATMFSASDDPLTAGKRTNGLGIRRAIDWAQTGRGGLQRMLQIEPAESCSSTYGLCE